MAADSSTVADSTSAQGSPATLGKRRRTTPKGRSPSPGTPAKRNATNGTAADARSKSPVIRRTRGKAAAGTKIEPKLKEEEIETLFEAIPDDGSAALPSRTRKSLITVMRNIDPIGILDERLRHADKLPYATLAEALDHELTADSFMTVVGRACQAILTRQATLTINEKRGDGRSEEAEEAPLTLAQHNAGSSHDPKLAQKRLEQYRREGEVLHLTTTFSETVRSILNDALQRDLSARPISPDQGLPYYMLHRTVAGRSDVYTGPAQLTPEDVLRLAELKDTDVVQIANGPTRHDELKPSQPHKTLGSILSAGLAPARQLIRPKLSEPNMLYYDPFASFAPSYDSAGASLSYGQQLERLMSRQRASEARHRPASGPSSRAIEPIAIEDPGEIDPQLLEGYSLNTRDIIEAVEDMAEEEEITRRLVENAGRLRSLQAAQLNRLHAQARNHDIHIPVKLAATEQEAREAKYLLASLGSLVSICSSQDSLIPSAESLRRAQAIYIPKSIDASEEQHGLLGGEHLQRAFPDSVLTAPPQARGQPIIGNTGTFAATSGAYIPPANPTHAPRTFSLDNAAEKEGARIRQLPPTSYVQPRRYNISYAASSPTVGPHARK
ncbi:uncharacterized protein L969DRAFT_279374 [Mixia osmundae IAM 14324]|uniref:Uncharacterized protein n=1 Tax=Mixia osmundae (strain CBS 9802 / IAM 14324 / JCM 22182 / KY 12970) TaxID=764103 RepID=G7E4E1_MIXOS|nr:uncharacterized protein L969DRAFT_279374 [Mixia osmundae IAM 14324]KEI36283.1 hypothetical protein L969DRAFT_279374 [Mixia osmundae IAM 14324]GAA97701.1 hypothetical protein E5Q_04379 [Mixia osmundae IAM 14324]